MFTFTEKQVVTDVKAQPTHLTNGLKKIYCKVCIYILLLYYVNVYLLWRQRKKCGNSIVEHVLIFNNIQNKREIMLYLVFHLFISCSLNSDHIVYLDLLSLGSIIKFFFPIFSLSFFNMTKKPIIQQVLYCPF